MGSVVSLAACSDTETDLGDEGAITSIPETSPRDQKETGNCWLYATAAWVESLEIAAVRMKNDGAPAPTHYAAAYGDYWDWYDKITGGKIHGTTVAAIKDELDSGGSWGSAVELVLERGLVHDADFLGDGPNVDAKATTAAVAALAESLTHGPLASATSRANGALVRKEIERAYKLPSAFSKAMTDVFGSDGSRTLLAGAVASGIVSDADHITVVHPHVDGPLTLGTLREAIGDRAGQDNPDARTGPLAWSDVVYAASTPDEQRAFFKRIQRALRAGVPLPFGWYWASNADPTDTGAFTALPPKASPASDTDSVDHETLLTDYQAADVPGFGDLAAGAPASAAQQDAALSDDTRIVFFRAKDSYYASRKGKNARVGYSDLYVDYLVNPVRVCPAGVSSTSDKCEDKIPLEDVTLPPGF